MRNNILQQGCPNKLCVKYCKNADAADVADAVTDATAVTVAVADVAVHDKKLNRLRCRVCGKTWSAHSSEFYFGLRTKPARVCRALDMLRAGISIRKIARLVDVNAGTVMRWKNKFANHF